MLSKIANPRQPSKSKSHFLIPGPPIKTTSRRLFGLSLLKEILTSDPWQIQKGILTKKGINEI